MCIKDGSSSIFKCLQRNLTYHVNNIVEDQFNKCADPNKPLLVLIDFTLKRLKKKDDLPITNSSYCCDEKFRNKSRITRIDDHCCGTAFAVCDDVSGNHKKYTPVFPCCGTKRVGKLARSKITTYESNCGPRNNEASSQPIKMEYLQYQKYVAKILGKRETDFKLLIEPRNNGYGFCNYVSSGRPEVTKDLSSTKIGSDLKCLCRTGKKRRTTQETNLSCPSNRQYMYQWQDTTNICCSKADHLHRSEEDEILADCCINNFHMYPGQDDRDTYNRHGNMFCSVLPKLKCCEGQCKRHNEGPGCTSNRKKDCDRPDVCAGPYYDGTGSAFTTPLPSAPGVRSDEGSSKPRNSVIIRCDDDYLFDAADSEYANITGLVK
jgi:hypothetical protein